MCSESKSAEGGGACPKRTNGVLKSLKVHRNVTSSNTTLTGLSDGSVMARNCRHLDAPSRLAASYISDGMLCRPANKKRNANGQLRQVAVMTMLQKAFVPTSQKGGLLTCRALSSALIAPLSFCSIKLHVMTTM